jgi:hypothetical protein
MKWNEEIRRKSKIRRLRMSNKEKVLGRTAVEEKEEKKSRHVEETCSYVSSFHREIGLYLGQGTKQEKLSKITAAPSMCLCKSLVWHVTPLLQPSKLKPRYRWLL